MAEAAVVPLVEQAIGFGLGKLRYKIACSKQLDERHRKLNQALRDLLALKEDKEREVERQKQKDTTNVYRRWTNRILEIVKDVASLNEKYEEVKQWRWWRIGKRSRLGEKMATKAEELLEYQAKLPNDIFVDKLPERVRKELRVPEISQYQTLQKALKDVLALLKNERVKFIGVLGGKGVGKTTIMQNLNNNEEVAKLFEIVIFIKVPAKSTDVQIQQKIADRLMVDTKANDFDDVARRILKELEKKKYLLILDGVEHQIDLNCLGIPEDNNDGKVVITAQDHTVWSLNAIDRLVKIGMLSDDEAWMMFKNIVGDVIKKPDIQGIAHLVCKRCCARLPILIKHIASSFRDRKTASSWRAGLNDFNPWPKHEIKGLDELYSYLEFCYNQLKDKNKQKCFLYTSLHLADSKIFIDYLVECWIAQRFLGDVDATYQSVREKGMETLDALINASLIEGEEQMIYVEMNDCIRQLAFYISSKDSECRSYLENEESEEPLRSDSWQHARWVYMIGNKRDTLPTQNGCSMLETLLLQKSLKLVEIPQDYFDMCNLLVLNLYGTKIRKLPSLSKLERLKALYLNDCSDLEMLPSDIQPLQLLEVFDIRGTKVNFIPCLINLRCLRIPYIRSIDQRRDEDNHGEISKLCRLEELVIELGLWFNDADEHIIQQFAPLKNLTAIRCDFPSSETFAKFVETRTPWINQKQFTSFQFFVGCKNSEDHKIFYSFEYRISKYVKYYNGDKKGDLAISKIVPQTEVLELICYRDMTNLSKFAETSSFESIRGFFIESCGEVSTIFAGDPADNAMNGITPGNGSLFPKLEQLHLNDLVKLNCVFRGPIYPNSFCRLHTLTLKDCPILENMFSEVTEMKPRAVPKLKVVILDNLPILRSMCPNENLEWPSLELLNIQKCPELKSLPCSMTNAVNLRTIRGEQEWWSNLAWTDKEVGKRFESTFSAST